MKQLRARLGKAEAAAPFNAVRWLAAGNYTSPAWEALTDEEFEAVDAEIDRRLREQECAGINEHGEAVYWAFQGRLQAMSDEELEAATEADLRAILNLLKEEVR